MRRDFRLHLRCHTDDDFRQQCADWAEGLVRINEYEIERYGHELPCCLGCGGVRYVLPPGCPTGDACQEVLDAIGLYQLRKGTCLDLAAELCARIRQPDWTNPDPEAVVLITDQTDAYDQPIPGQFHAQVLRSSGVIEDPAEFLQKNAGACLRGVVHVS